MAWNRIRHAALAVITSAAFACSGDDATDDGQGGTSPQTSIDTDPTDGSGSADSVGGSGMNGTTGSGSATGGADTTDDAGSGDSGGQSGWEACGLSPPTGPGDSVEPQHPDSPEIVTACTALCTAWAGIADCPADMTTCLEDCSQRTCQICPGTLAPLVDCETANFDEAACVCGESGPTCPTPSACDEQADQTGFCGG